MILPIKHTEYWGLMSQQNQTKVNKDKICENSKRLYHDYKVGDEFMLNNNSAFKYETPYLGSFEMTHCWTNGTVIL